MLCVNDELNFKDIDRIPIKTKIIDITVVQFIFSPRRRNAKNACQIIPDDLNKVAISTPDIKIPKFPEAIIIP